MISLIESTYWFTTENPFGPEEIKNIEETTGGTLELVDRIPFREETGLTL